MARATAGKSAKKTEGREAPPRIAIFHGPERYMQEQLTQQLRERLAAAHGAGGADAIDLVRFDGATAAVADVLDECRSMGLMQQHKLVVVDNADQLVKSAEEEEEPAAKPASRAGRRAPARKSNRQLLEAYAAAPAEGATLVLRADAWRPGNLDKAVAAVGVVRKCEVPSLDDAAAWAIQRCRKQHGAEIEPEAARLLAEQLGGELMRMDTELARLSLLDPGRPITVAIVRQTVGLSREEEFWAIHRSLLSGDAAAALGHLRELLEVSRIDPVPLTWSYIDLARKLHGIARGLRQRENRGMLFRRFRLWGGPGEEVMRRAEKIDPRDAAAILDEAIQADLRQKSSGGDPVRALEALTLRFTSVMR